MISEQRIIELAKEAGFDIDGGAIFASDNVKLDNTDLAPMLNAFANALQAEWIKSLGEPYAFELKGNIGSRFYTDYEEAVKWQALDGIRGKVDLTSLYALPNEEVK